MSLYYYNIYGINISCNVELSLLEQIKDCDPQLKVVFVKGEVLECSKVIVESDDTINVYLGNIANYKVDVKNNYIECISENEEAFFSTLFNIPFSIYFLKQKEILFHTCTIVLNDKVFCLCGNKGVGKSTLTKLLSEYDRVDVFGDDTLRIAINGKCFKAHNLIKLTEETAEKFNIEKGVTHRKNCAGKLYFVNDDKYDNVMIDYIVQIYRTSQKAPYITFVETDSIKEYICRKNIVGIEYFTYPMLSQLLSNLKYVKGKYLNLYVPDDFEGIKTNGNYVYKLLCECV